VALVLLDLDHFKSINDRHGHDAGDRALVAVAEVLKGATRAGDLAARMGGEEFIVLLEGCGEGQALQFAERLREQLSRLRIAGRWRGAAADRQPGVAVQQAP
jgi:diguanylate cyclase (GGDEF)-like protein